MALALCAACKAGPVDLPEAPPAVLQPTTDQVFPAEPASLVWAITGGMTGGGARKIEIWRDGTVRFSHGSCPSPRKALLPPARAAALLDALDHNGVYSLESHPPECCDRFYDDLEISAPGKHAKVGRSQPMQDDDLASMLKLINRVVGPTPCRR